MYCLLGTIFPPPLFEDCLRVNIIKGIYGACMSTFSILDMLSCICLKPASVLFKYVNVFQKERIVMVGKRNRCPWSKSVIKQIFGGSRWYYVAGCMEILQWCCAWVAQYVGITCFFC